MSTALFVIGSIALIALIAWASNNLLYRAAKPLSRVDHLVSFPPLVTLSITRKEVPALAHAGVYDSVAVQRNPYALELRLTNSTDPKSLDPFSFYVPLDQTSLRQLASVLTSEADRLDEVGSPYWR